MSQGIPQFGVTATFPKDPRLFVRDHNRFMYEANFRGAKRHHKRHVPWHFEKFAKAKYGYFKRTDKYNARKLQQVGHTQELVFTGATRRNVMAKGDITATPKGSKLVVRMQIKGGSGRVVDAAAAARLFAAGKRKTATISQQQLQSQAQIIKRVTEMGAVAADEIADLQSYIAVEYINQANAPGTPYRVRYHTR